MHKHCGEEHKNERKWPERVERQPLDDAAQASARHNEVQHSDIKRDLDAMEPCHVPEDGTGPTLVWRQNAHVPIVRGVNGKAVGRNMAREGA